VRRAPSLRDLMKGRGRWTFSARRTSSSRPRSSWSHSPSPTTAPNGPVSCAETAPDGRTWRTAADCIHLDQRRRSPGLCDPKTGEAHQAQD
jgi:hypothetical protein